jgi:phosphoglycolate phosphatase (TIGR01487 family)
MVSLSTFILKAIACDYDSTLTSHHGRLNLKAVEKIHYLEENGIRVILNTSREFMTAMTLSLAIGSCGVFVSEDGSVIGRLIDFPPEPRIIGDINNVKAGLKALQQAFGDHIVVIPWPGRFCSIVLGRVDTFTVDEANALLSASNTGAQLLDSGFTFHIVDACVNKGSGLREVADFLGISTQEFAAIGDNYNDMPMFAEAGYSIAVGNAPDVVKQQVDYACKANYGDGFIEGVDHLLSMYRHNLQEIDHSQT